MGVSPLVASYRLSRRLLLDEGVGGKARLKISDLEGVHTEIACLVRAIAKNYTGRHLSSLVCY